MLDCVGSNKKAGGNHEKVCHPQDWTSYGMIPFENPVATGESLNSTMVCAMALLGVASSRAAIAISTWPFGTGQGSLPLI